MRPPSRRLNPIETALSGAFWEGFREVLPLLCDRNGARDTQARKTLMEADSWRLVFTDVPPNPFGFWGCIYG
jgi:hypothetical protein